jgi:glycosyltransferase involved in cell wall biosynthesis
MQIKNREGENKFLVEFHGNFIPLQGVEYIVMAAKILEHDEDIKFKIIGAGYSYPKSRALSEELVLKNIDFLGKMPLEQIPKYLAEADICLGNFGDTGKTQRIISNKVYEAAAMGKPIISADVPAMREIFEDRKNILFCRHADPQDLADKILELRNNVELRKQIAQGAYELFQKCATPKIIVKNLLKDLGYEN